MNCSRLPETHPPPPARRIAPESPLIQCFPGVNVVEPTPARRHLSWQLADYSAYWSYLLPFWRAILSSDNPVTSVHGGWDGSCSLQLCGCSIRHVVYRWLSWQQYGCDVVVIHRVVSPSTWSIVLRVNATCAYTWRATFAHLEPMHLLTAAPCPIISGYGSKVKDRITCRSIGSGSPRPRLLMNAINCYCSAKYEACKEANGICRRLKLNWTAQQPQG